MLFGLVVMNCTSMQVIIFCLLLFFAIGTHQHAHSIGYFWQISDIHLDANYSLDGDPDSMCHKTVKDQTFANKVMGKFGDYNCDAPEILLKSALSFIKSQTWAKPDFVLWTGDNLPHIPNSEYSTDKVNIQLHNLTTLLQDSFHDVPVLPCIGNHDSWPVYEVPFGEAGAVFYVNALSSWGWSSFLSKEEEVQFHQGGFYSWSPQGRQLVVISLNSGLWYRNNPLTNDTNDPAGQFQWLKTELQKARTAKKKVYLVSHIPPGFYSEFPFSSSLHLNHNHLLVDVMRSYSDVIAAGIFGHEHTDSFRIITGERGLTPVFISPAVTPWKGYVPNNPSVRLYQYSKKSYKILDYSQFFLNLSSADEKDTATWKLEYKLSTAYGIKDGSGSSYKKLFKKLYTNSYYFEKFRKYFTVSYSDNIVCNETCKKLNLCSFICLQNDSYSECVQSPSANTEFSKFISQPEGHSYWIIGFSVLGVFVFVSLVVILYCFRRDESRLYRRLPTFSIVREVEKQPLVSN